jgi:L-threonylcarbamoyladenylate synthase
LEQGLDLARFEKVALDLAIRFWPGPLTLVLPLGEGAPIAPLVNAGLETIALRCPAHPAMRDLLAASGKPLAAPSANASGRISPTRAQHVLASLGGRIPFVVDAGPTAHGLESTIVAVSEGQLRLLRPGPISIEAEPSSLDRIEAPGQLASHYAPSKPVRLDATEASPEEWLIGFGSMDGDNNLSPSGDLIQAAANLFQLLHEAEGQSKPKIAVAPVPLHGLGAAINDRLRRAAAPRS